MIDRQATLLLTRPQPQSETFLDACTAALGRPVPAVISPLIQIEATGNMPDLDRYSAVLVTSANALRTLGSGLSGRKVFTVGQATARLADSLGAKAICLGENVDQFVENAAQVDSPAVFCRGAHSRGDLANRLRRAGLSVDETVIYDQIARPLSEPALALLTGNTPVVAPVFSPRSAQLLSGQTTTAPITVVAISNAAADAWSGKGQILVAEAPTAVAMVSAVAKVI